MHIDRVAEAGIGVEHDRNVGMSRSMSCVIDNVTQPEDAGIGNTEQKTGDLRAREKEATEPDILHHARVDRAEAARHHDDVIAVEQAAVLQAFARGLVYALIHRFFFLHFPHPFLP